MHNTLGCPRTPRPCCDSSQAQVNIPSRCLCSIQRSGSSAGLQVRFHCTLAVAPPVLFGMLYRFGLVNRCLFMRSSTKRRRGARSVWLLCQVRVHTCADIATRVASPPCRLDRVADIAKHLRLAAPRPRPLFSPLSPSATYKQPTSSTSLNPNAVAACDTSYRQADFYPGLQVRGQGFLAVGAVAKWQEECGRHPSLVLHRSIVRFECEKLLVGRRKRDGGRGGKSHGRNEKLKK